VVMVEHTSRGGDRVHVTRSVATNENIVASGAEAKRGDKLLARVCGSATPKSQLQRRWSLAGVSASEAARGGAFDRR